MRASAPAPRDPGRYSAREQWARPRDRAGFVAALDVRGGPGALGITTILLSHIGFYIPFVAVSVRARVQGMDRASEDTAQDLFATPMVAFIKVTLPLMAGGLLAFVLSLDDFVITNFVPGQTQTFSIWVYGTTRIGLPPQVKVMGTVLWLAAC